MAFITKNVAKLADNVLGIDRPSAPMMQPQVAPTTVPTNTPIQTSTLIREKNAPILAPKTDRNRSDALGAYGGGASGIALDPLGRRGGGYIGSGKSLLGR